MLRFEVPLLFQSTFLQFAGGRSHDVAPAGTARLWFDQAGADLKLSVAGGGYASVTPFLSVYAFGATGDGVTDDTAAIQAALDAAGSGTPGTPSDVLLPSGVYMLSAPLLVASNTRFLGTPGSLLKIKNSVNPFAAVRVLQESDVILAGLRIDGNKANNTDGFGIIIQGGTRVMVRDCHVQNARLESFYIGKNEAGAGLSENCSILGCTSLNPSYSGGFRQHYAVTQGKKLVIAGCIGDSTDGFATYLVDLEPNNNINPIEDVAVIGNVGYDAKLCAVNGEAATAGVIKRIRVADNVCFGVGAGGGTGLVVRYASTVGISDNTMDRIGANAVELLSATDVSITGNTLTNYGVHNTAGEQNAVKIETGCTAFIDDNLFRASASASAPKGIVEVSTGHTTLVGFNQFLGVPEADYATLNSVASRGVRRASVTGSRGGNAAIANLLTALASAGIIVDSTSA